MTETLYSAGRIEVRKVPFWKIGFYRFSALRIVIGTCLTLGFGWLIGHVATRGPEMPYNIQAAVIGGLIMLHFAFIKSETLLEVFYLVSVGTLAFILGFPELGFVCVCALAISVYRKFFKAWRPTLRTAYIPQNVMWEFVPDHALRRPATACEACPVRYPLVPGWIYEKTEPDTTYSKGRFLTKPKRLNGERYKCSHCGSIYEIGNDEW